MSEGRRFVDMVHLWYKAPGVPTLILLMGV